MTALVPVHLATARRRVPRGSVLLGALGICMLLVLWEAGALIVERTSAHPERVLPSLGYVFGTALPDVGKTEDVAGGAGAVVVESASTGRASYREAFDVLWRQSYVTLKRVLLGTAAGALIGVGLGLLVGLSPLARRALFPAVNIVRQVPLLALSLLFAIWFGGAETGIYAYVIFGVSTMIVINTISAVRNVPRVQLEFARTLGAGRMRGVTTVIVPAILPELAAGLKVAIGLSWAMVLAAEYLGTQEGLGRMMLFYEYFQQTGRMVVVLGAFVFWAVIVHLVVTAITNRMTRWAG